MSSFKTCILATGALLAVSLSAVSAYADDPYHYCSWYARTAVSQARAAYSVGACRHFIAEDPARWHTNYGVHFQWCLSVFGSGKNVVEHQARVDALSACVN